MFFEWTTDTMAWSKRSLRCGACLMSGRNKVLQSRLYFLPTPRFQTAVRIHPQTFLGNHLRGGTDEAEHFFGRRHARRMNVPNARTNIVRVMKLRECAE